MVLRGGEAWPLLEHIWEQCVTRHAVVRWSEGRDFGSGKTTSGPCTSCSSCASLCVIGDAGDLPCEGTPPLH